jgi:hypothetical protein
VKLLASSNLPFTIGIGLFGNSELLPTLLAGYALSAVYGQASQSKGALVKRTADEAHSAQSVDNAMTRSDVIDVLAQSVGQSSPCKKSPSAFENAGTA